MDDFFDSFKGKPKYDHKVRVVHFKKEPFDIYIGRLPNGKFNKWAYPKELQEIFNKQGIEVEIYDYTPDLDMIDRGQEIKTWLDNNQCDNYVVIDDRTADIEPYVNNVVKCRSWLGLTNDEYLEIKNILQNE